MPYDVYTRNKRTLDNIYNRKVFKKHVFILNNTEGYFWDDYDISHIYREKTPQKHFTTSSTQTTNHSSTSSTQTTPIFSTTAATQTSNQSSTSSTQTSLEVFDITTQTSPIFYFPVPSINLLEITKSLLTNRYI